MPPSTLISKVFGRAVAPFLAATLEHLAIAKAFARKNNYTIDPAQELVYLGITNFFNSFFSAMPIGGAMSRTAVNSATGVRSPVYGLVAGAFVLLSIFVLSPESNARGYHRRRCMVHTLTTKYLCALLENFFRRLHSLHARLLGHALRQH
jgi:hypothetical protein